MSEPLHLRPGAAMPPWVETLERTAFEGPWGSLAHHEHIFGFPPHAYIRWSAVPAAHEAELLRLAVSPGARRRGLARQLLEVSEAFLRSEGIGTLFLEVRSSNQAARSLYEATGWKLQRARKAYYQDGEDALIYGKHLEP
jgi:ribosomal protein S18 acetylase RimI-like enzyme